MSGWIKVSRSLALAIVLTVCAAAAVPGAHAEGKSGNTGTTAGGKASKSGDAKSGDKAIYLSPAEIEEIKKGSACKSIIRQVIALKKKMASAGLDTEFYDLTILPTDQLIKDQRGTYYAVYLKDASNRERFQFGSGEYTIDDFDTRFRGALSSFVREVLAPLHGGIDYKIYVRGSASSRPMRGKRDMNSDVPLHAVTWLPAAGDDLYDGNRTETTTFSEKYGNEDLPYLRAGFLQKIVKDFYPLSAPIVLESKVSESRSRKEQFAELLLFVDWQR